MTTRDRKSYTDAGRRIEEQAAKPVTEVAIARKEMERHQSFLQQRLAQLGRWVTHGMKPEALIRFAMLDLQQTPRLRECDPGTIYLALLACAQTGLEPGALKQEAFLIPFRDNKAKIVRAQFMAGYRGIIKQARRTREVHGFTGNVVRERDVFDLDLGSQPRLVHKPLLTGDRGGVIGAYAIAKLSGGHSEIEWMDGDDLKGIEQAARNRGPSLAWDNWPDQMQRKAPIRRLGKRLPLGNDYYVAAAVEQAETAQEAADILDVVTEGDASQALVESARAAEMARDAAPDPDTWAPPPPPEGA